MSSENTMPSTTREIVSPIHHEPGTDRREFLINNGVMSDVTFLVGPDRQRIYGHKLILMSAADHFFGLFQNSKATEIPLEDVEPSVFLDILRFLYCEKIVFTIENAREIYLQSRKWSLEKVMEAAINFLNQYIDSTNVLKVLRENRVYDMKMVEEKCLEIICENPFRYTEQEGFRLLDRESLKLIVTAKTINCSKDQLMGVLDAWQEVQNKEDVADLRAAIKGSNPLFDCDQLRFFGYLNSGYVPQGSFHLTSSNRRVSGIRLIGLGVIYFSQEKNVTVTVSCASGESDIEKTCAFRNPCMSTVNVADIFFEHLEIEVGYSISVTVKFSTNVDYFHFAFYELYHRHISISSKKITPPIAYFHYKEIEQKW
ncbi:BTB/POZ domain-containing protein 6-like [Topomyia yanbarensis]|uniref:BTB/POZ domain-containing protein 6-like n=1 Tax=Topomyia yanbarensis TaxID=2498891 RepID=UPI00273B1F79|nr:BTB/POZ domain-containing protein 6-like [Topomyia yanbarensis]